MGEQSAKAGGFGWGAQAGPGLGLLFSMKKVRSHPPQGENGKSLGREKV